jgi:choline dehydrogenase-like flavoprotein
MAVVISRHRRATGVTVLVDGRVETLTAGLIVLCGGALETPQLLVRSGIGPATVLTAAGLRVVHDAPVGAQLHDHPQVVVRFELPPNVLTQPVETSLGVSAHGSSGIAGDIGDLEVLSVLRPLGRMLGTQPHDAHLSLLVSALRTTTPGALRFDVAGPPLFDFRYLDSESDRERLRRAVRLATAMLESDAMRQLGAKPEHPGLGHRTDGELDAWMLDHLSTALHSCGTTPMGTDPATSVVDGRGAVRGVEGLVIADLGIVPSTPTGGPAATAVLIGEVIADALTS